MAANKLRIAFLIILFTKLTYGSIQYDVIVDQSGNGDFTTLSEAIASLPGGNYDRKIVYIRKGVYEERIIIKQDYITIIGEDRDSTIIQYNLPRKEWIKDPDMIGPAVLNIEGDDIILQNLTIKNTQPQIGPHAFAVYGTGTRTILLDCTVIGKGGDTVSLWNYKHGMYYHANCYFSGAVDFVCPRGWCYIKDSEFYEVKNTAALWHAAVTDPDQKFVLENCKFDGVEGYSLARHHYEAQFYFLHCQFSQTMSDHKIAQKRYPDNPAKNRPYFYGDRHYFYDCHREGGDYDWHRDNPGDWPENITPDSIDVYWAFDHRWDPENSSPVSILNYSVDENGILFYFDELVGVRELPVFKTSSGKELHYVEGSGRDILRFTWEGSASGIELKPGKTLRLERGEIYAIRARVKERKVAGEIILP